MIRETQMADAPLLAFFLQEVEHTVVDKSFVEVLFSWTYTVEQIEVDVVKTQFFEGVIVDGF